MVNKIQDKPAQELCNIEAEQSVLGTIIINNEYLNRVSEFLREEHFAVSAHQKIYARILHNVEKANVVSDKVTLKQFFAADESIKEIGGVNYLSVLLSHASSVIDIAEYGKVIQDLALQRDLVMMAKDVISRIEYSEDKIPALDQVELAESELFKLSSQNTGKGGFRKLSASMQEAMQNTMIARQKDDHVSGVPTGFADLDKMLGGMQQSDLIILAGRPSIGKTSLGINIAFNACKILNKNVKSEKDQKAVGFFSLEMTDTQLATRILSMESSVNATKFRTGKVSDAEWSAVVDRNSAMEELPFFIDQTPALSISAIRTRTRKLVRKHNLAFLVVDYLQLMKGSVTRSSEGRVQEISEITQGLKSIAKEFNIPVMALSQLSREVEKREDKKPQLSDLRESGSIEQDADVVAFIYRESYYHERKRPDEKDPKFSEWKNKMNEICHISEVMIAKQRNGPIGTVQLYFDAEFTRFGNLERYKK